MGAARFLLALLLGAALPAASSPPADSARVRRLLQQGEYSSDTAESRRLLLQGLAAARDAHLLPAQAQAYMQLAYLAGIGNDLPRVRTYLQQARALIQTARLPPALRRQKLAVVADKEAILYAHEGNLPAAAGSLIQAADYLRQNPRPEAGSQLLAVYVRLGGLMTDLRQPTKARFYYGQALALQQYAAPYERANLLLTMAEYYDDQHRPRQAAPYLAQARSLVGPQDPDLLVRYTSEKGENELGLGQVQQAIETLKLAVRLAGQSPDVGPRSYALSQLAAAYERAGNYPAARRSLQQSLAYGRQAHDTPAVLATLEELGQLEERAGLPASAVQTLRRFISLNDSLNNATVQTRIHGLETQYRTRAQAQQIAALHQAQRLKVAELRRQQTLTYAALALAALLLGAGGLGLVALRSRRQLERKERELQARKIQELEQQQQLLATEAMLRGQEEERSRLARDLHDGLGGMLSSVKYTLGSVRGAVVLSESSAQLFTHSLAQLDSSINELRRVARDMMPEALLQFGLVPALHDVCEALSQREQLRVQFQAYGFEAEADRLPQRTEVVVYRLVQELLNNVLKHARASQALVQLIRDQDQVQLVVEDDGRGFDPAAPRSGVGLRSIQARVDYLRGTLDLHSAPGQGTTVTIEFTLMRNEE